MTDLPQDLLAQAEQLEKKLRDQQAELVDRQQTLDKTLRKQSEHLRARDLERLEEVERTLEKLALETEIYERKSRQAEMEMQRKRAEMEMQRQRAEMYLRREHALRSIQEMLALRRLLMILGVVLLVLFLLSLLALGNSALAGLGIALLALLLTVYLREKSVQEELKNIHERDRNDSDQ